MTLNRIDPPKQQQQNPVDDDAHGKSRLVVFPPHGSMLTVRLFSGRGCCPW
jgi:hypothetical protein